MTLFKVHSANKSYPAKIKILAKTGSFEVFVSKNETISKNEYDFTFCTNEYSLTYEDSDSIKYLYFGIKASERLRIQFSISFTQESERPKIVIKKPLAEPKTMEKHASKKSIYEFFRESMRQDEFLELKDLVGNTLYKVF